LHKPNIMSGMLFPTFACNLSPTVTKPGAQSSVFSTTRKVSFLSVSHNAWPLILSLLLSQVCSHLVTVTIVLDHCWQCQESEIYSWST
jgi:hypothetical protein